MQHPCLLVVVSFLFDEFFIKITSRAVHHILFYFETRLAGQGHAPKHISSHEVIAIAVFPPAPPAVGMLEVVETFQTRLRDAVEFLQIAFTFRMSGRRGRWFDAAKDLAHRGLDRKSTRLNSSHLVISYAVFCLKKKK